MKCGTNGCEKCTHSEEKPTINGVYTTPEIQMAIEIG